MGSYKVIQNIENVAYKLELPLSLSRIHDVFHVSIFKKYHPDPSHVLWSEEVKIDENLSYEEKSVKLLDRKVKELRHKQIPLVKVLWKNHGIEEAIWEVEEEIRKKYLELFVNQCMNFENEILLREERCEDSKIFSFVYFYWFIYLFIYSFAPINLFH